MNFQITQNHHNFAETHQTQFRLQHDAFVRGIEDKLSSSVVHPQKSIRLSNIRMEQAKKKELGPSSDSEDTINIGGEDAESSFGVIQRDPDSGHLVTVLDDSAHEQVYDLEQLFEDKRSQEKKAELAMLESGGPLKQRKAKFQISLKAMKADKKNYPMTTQPISDSSSPGLYEPYFTNGNGSNSLADVSSKQYLSCENSFCDPYKNLCNQGKDLMRFGSLAKSISPNILPPQKFNGPRTRHVSAQIMPLSSWDKSSSDPKVSSEEASSKANQSLSCMRQMKPKTSDLIRKEIPRTTVIQGKSKKQIEFHKIMSKQLSGISLIPGEKRQSTITSEESRIGSSVVMAAKVRTTTNQLSERMKKIKILSRATSSLKSENDQRAASFEYPDSSIEKKEKQSIKKIVMKRQILLKQNQKAMILPVKQQPLTLKITQANTKLGFQRKATLTTKETSLIRDSNVRNKSNQSQGSVQSGTSRKLKFIIKKQPFLNKFDKKSQVSKKSIINEPRQNLKRSPANEDIKENPYSIVEQSTDKIEEPVEQEIHDSADKLLYTKMQHSKENVHDTFLETNKLQSQKFSDSHHGHLRNSGSSKGGHYKTPKFNDKDSTISSRKRRRMTLNSLQLEGQLQSSHSMDVKEENAVDFQCSQESKQDTHQIPRDSSHLIQMNVKFPILQRDSKSVDFQICQQEFSPEFQKPSPSNFETKLGKVLSSNSSPSNFKASQRLGPGPTYQLQMFNKGNQMYDHRNAFYVKSSCENSPEDIKEENGFEGSNDSKNLERSKSLETKLLRSPLEDSFKNESLEERPEESFERRPIQDSVCRQNKMVPVMKFQDKIYRPANLRVNTSSTQISASPIMTPLQFNKLLDRSKMKETPQISARDNYQSQSSAAIDLNQSFGLGTHVTTMDNRHAPINDETSSKFNFDLISKNYNSNDKVDRAQQKVFGGSLASVHKGLHPKKLRTPLNRNGGHAVIRSQHQLLQKHTNGILVFKKREGLVPTADVISEKTVASPNYRPPKRAEVEKRKSICFNSPHTLGGIRHFVFPSTGMNE